MVSLVKQSKIKISLFGESHGDSIGATLHGLPAGIKVDYDLIARELKRRNPPDLNGTTPRKEADNIEFISGVYNDYTTGSPLTLTIKNSNVNSNHYPKNIMRPSTSDFVAHVKSGGFNDHRGSGHYSARLTAPLVAIASVIKPYLKEKFSVDILSHVVQIGLVKDESWLNFPLDNLLKYKDIGDSFLVCDSHVKNEMLKIVDDVKAKGDSVGGKIETAILGIPAGLGGDFFDGLESSLASAIFSIPSVKAVEFGLGADFASKTASCCNDELAYSEISNKSDNPDNTEKKITHLSNNMGGITAGLSNGNPIIINTTFKPVPSISKEQRTINIDTKENCTIKIDGRHDSCQVLRSSVILESVIALKVLDLLI